MKYEEMLKNAIENLPDQEAGKQRFDVPKVKGHIQGNRTILSNFHIIAKTINRDPEHLLKFILRELASPGELSESAAIIKSKVSSEKVNNKINKYVHEFVICPDCGKPDTILKKEKGLTIKVCHACGSKHPVRTIK
jgi:translation initiation factor 2 subunit 2